MKRIDGAGRLWDKAAVETAIKRIVARLTPGKRPGGLARKTRLEADLGWDKWYKLEVVAPVRRRLHETLEADVVLYEVRTVGDLVDRVWSRMDPVRGGA